MSFGGSDTTTKTVNIPSDLQSLLSSRTTLTADQIGTVSKLFDSLAAGDPNALSTYTSSLIPNRELSGLSQKNTILNATPSAGGQLDRALAQNTTATETARATDSGNANKSLFDVLAGLVAKQSYPTGGTSTSSSDPGILGYINIVSNLISSYGASGISTDGGVGPGGSSGSQGQIGNASQSPYAGIGKLFGGGGGAPVNTSPGGVAGF